jgi:hypothetical protein
MTSDDASRARREEEAAREQLREAEVEARETLEAAEELEPETGRASVGEGVAEPEEERVGDAGQREREN